MTSDVSDELITRAEAARRLGVTTTTIDTYRARGHLGTVRASIGRRTWIPAADVERVRRARLGQIR